VPIDVPERDCSFCANFEGVIPSHGPPAVVFENDSLYVLMAPASLGGMPGHTLVCTKRHVETVIELTDEECADVMRMVRDVATGIRDEFDPNGIHVQQHNGASGWQTVPHLHVHVIPVMQYDDWPPKSWIETTPSEIRAKHAAALRCRLAWTE